MKDERLEREFEEYFKGVKTPDNITGDAKRFVKPKPKVLPKVLKFASIAASFVLVFAVALTIVLKMNFNKDGNGFKTYTDADLTYSDANAYTVSTLDGSLKFIENFAVASNVGVDLCEAGYRNGKLALAKAEIRVLDGLTRDETQIYVEFTDEKLIYKGLADYCKGDKKDYRGAEYYLTAGTAENGEPQFKLYVNYEGVKYYFNVTSSDENAYLKYLKLIVK